MSSRSRLLLVSVWSASLVALGGCKDQCEKAADVLSEACGDANTEEATGEECAADSEILAECVTENEGKTCAEIQAACFAP